MAGGIRGLWLQGRARTVAGGQCSVTFKGLRDELHYRLAIRVTSGLAFSWTRDSGGLMSHQTHAQPRGAPGTEGGLLFPSPGGLPALTFPRSPKRGFRGSGILKTLFSPESGLPWPALGLGNLLATFLPPSLSGAFAKPAFWGMSFAPIGCAVTFPRGAGGRHQPALGAVRGYGGPVPAQGSPGEIPTVPTPSPSSARMMEGW